MIQKSKTKNRQLAPLKIGRKLNSAKLGQTIFEAKFSMLVHLFLKYAET